MKSLTSRFDREVFEPYLELLKAQYRFHPRFEHAKQVWEQKLSKEELVGGPYLERSQIYEDGEPVEQLPLHHKTVATIRRKLSDRSLWKHQTDALRLGLAGKNVVIATGTSSGKTLCYQIPILDDLLRDPSPGLRAVIIYPLNALVNDQLNEWEEMLKTHTQITFARFTGQTPDSQKEYEERLREVIKEQLSDQRLTQQQLQREVERRLQEEIAKDSPNRLNHREAIRSHPPHVLITNFSMLEYLLERPVDAPVFENARLNFLVLDEAHAYRGVQATEIAFLIRRLKDRLGIERLTCIATSATLGKPNDAESGAQVRAFASNLFGEQFYPPTNPIYGVTAQPELKSPSFRPTITQYIEAAERLRSNPQADVRQQLGMGASELTLGSLLGHDESLYFLRKDVLTKPRLLRDAAQELWPAEPRAEEGLEALLEIVGAAKKDGVHGDLLPTRLHYFVRAQDGLHICLHKQCPGRVEGKPAFFVARKNEEEAPEGHCPDCFLAGRTSKLVEVTSCRKCGYLFGALQDLGPRRARDDAKGNHHFDSFSTELGWAADSFWSYFSVDDDLPYPPRPKEEEDEDDQEDLFLNPKELDWCVICGKKRDEGAGDNCTCGGPHLRKIRIFHRQCRADNCQNLYRQEKRLLTSCPNCGARNGCGLEPLRRFQESDDETGLAMAVPLAHFQVGVRGLPARAQRKLLCFTDHRQRAAAFPALLEEETFAHDMGRKIVNIVRDEKRLDLVSLGERLADIADKESSVYDPDFFLPVSRFPDEELDSKAKRNLWIAETFSYFGIPDSARESAEDLGLVAVEYELKGHEIATFRDIVGASMVSLEGAGDALQTLLGYMRQRKAFTLPSGRVAPDATAFGRVTADIAYALRRDGSKNTQGWLPLLNQDGSYRNNLITDYLRRLLGLDASAIVGVAETIWEFLTSQDLLIHHNQRWKLDHERLYITRPEARHVCMRCGIVTAYSAKLRCPRKECDGRLEVRPFNVAHSNIIERWVSGDTTLQFTTLKSEEHTAQINKDLAKRIEDQFRTEGVHLLSSTTTFEMGINIGDLQKVLLRNAPPTSANYLQRVGRAGRGEDKNSVCVTLCRRTKYDSDAWKYPLRLMSGEVRTPTVFTENGVIAQRHFNAVAFAKFLRLKLRDERILGEVQQQIRLESFLPLDFRTNIPDNWFQIRPTNLFLNFAEWIDRQTEASVFQTEAGRSLLQAIGGFDAGRDKAQAKYGEVLNAIGQELTAFMGERQRLFARGEATADIERSIKNLLRSDVIAVLAKRGFLPRYAFPLDVVTLETGFTQWLRDSDVELSRDRSLAIVEFAPGAQVIAHKKVFTSAGLYVVSSSDRPQRRWYSKCPGCDQIRAAATQEQLTGPCSICERSITAQYISPFVEPDAFSVRFDKKREGATARHRRNTLIRQRQTITHFIDSVENAAFSDSRLFRLALKRDGRLFRYNLGPENKGFMLCPYCGCSEPRSSFKPGRPHKRLRAFSGATECSNQQPWVKPLAYAHEFQSFCLIARPKLSPASVESLAYALQRGVCDVLELDTSDIGAAWRRVADMGVEIILYDHTPGGAGFVQEGYGRWQEVLERARELCQSCTCERACYDCLKSYSNQAHHEKLSRLCAIQSLNAG